MLENHSYSGAKLTADQVSQIKARALTGDSDTKIAALFGVNRSSISRIRRGLTWVRPGGRPKLDTHCRAGHRRTKANTFIGRNGYRRCKICRAEWDRKFKRKVKVEVEFG